ncbi:hypothetical protein M0805_001185 [Coniferiporia weirii]|nr:hypothetical protein M0805_001185 [Coniferiporia weirii]
MSHTTSALLSRGQSAIAIAGATGRLGQVITETLLTTFKPFFSRVIALTRDSSSSKAQDLAALGAELAEVRLDGGGEEIVAQLRNAFQGVDIVVNVLGMTDALVKDVVAQEAIGAGAKVYFPSEFGIDHRANDFPGFDHEEWIKKRKHFSYATELAEQKGGNVKVIAVYTGLFLEDSLDPRFGIDISTRTVTAIGPSDARVTYTSKVDIARAVAQLAILAMLSPAALADSVPAHVHIAGCTRSATEMAAALDRHTSPNKGKCRVMEESVNAAKDKLREAAATGRVGPPAGYIRVVMGEGKLDFSGDNSNELVNPNERLWKWDTVEEAVEKLVK